MEHYKFLYSSWACCAYLVLTLCGLALSHGNIVLAVDGKKIRQAHVCDYHNHEQAVQSAMTGSQEIDQSSSLATYAFILHWYDVISLSSSSVILYCCWTNADETVPDSRVISMYAVRVRENCPISGDAVALCVTVISDRFCRTSACSKAAVSATELATLSTLTSALDDVVSTSSTTWASKSCLEVKIATRKRWIKKFHETGSVS